MSYYARPEKQLLVKCTFNRSKRKIIFKSAQNCTYDLLRSKVEECFSLGDVSYAISYTDDDKETSNILTEDDLSEAIAFFNDGTGNDDISPSSSSSNYSGRSTGSRKITMHLEVNIDYDGRLSDTASLDDYHDDNESQPSFSFTSISRELDDDDVTVSSRDYIASSQIPNGQPAAEHESQSMHLSSSNWTPVPREQIVEGSELEGSPSGTQRAPDVAPQLPIAHDDLLEEQEDDGLSINFEPPAVNARNAAWLREQSSLHNLSNIGNIQHISKATDTVSQVDSEPIDGRFSLEKDTRGRYYYEYTPAASHHDPQEYEQYREEFVPDEVDICRRPSSMQLAWLASQQRVIPEDWGSLEDASSISLEEHSHGGQDYEHFLPQITTSTPPEVITECSHCGLLLETMRYVCSTCGPKSPGAPTSNGSNNSNLSSSTLQASSPSQRDFYLSPASSRTVVSSSLSLSNLDRSRPLPPLPISNAGCTRTIQPSGYELCAECVQSYGVLHAIESGLDRESSPLSAASTSTAVQGWHRSAPAKGKLRHAFREQIWESNRWIDLQQDDSTVRVCSMCGNETDKKRYKCAVCNKIHMCQSCYSQMHDLHPNHAFIVVPDVDVSKSFRVHPPQEEQPLLHRGVNCMNCRQEIIGARYHCPFCGVDICQNCEAAGLPGNLDPSDGGHDSTHIMLKIPYNLDAEKVDRLSHIARRFDPSETATVGRNGLISASANPSTSHVDISTSLGVNPLDYRLDHQMPCNGCRQMIVGVRYQCANCPSLSTSFSLCQICEERSHELHSPNHVFFRLPRPVDRPLESPAPFLPIMYSTPAGPMEEPFIIEEPKGYLQKLVHKSAVCDCCFEPIKGEWFRCVYCSRDLCHVCLRNDTHDESHFFVVFKSKVNMQTFKQHMMIDDLDVRPPIIPYAVYGKLI